MKNEEYFTSQLPKWVKTKMYSAISGYSETAIRQKTNGGVWTEGIHWIKSPDGHIMINHRAVDEWIEYGH